MPSTYTHCRSSDSQLVKKKKRSNEEIEASDIRTRKLLTMHGGVESVRATFHYEAKIQECIRKMAASDDMLSEWQQKPNEEAGGGKGPSRKDKPLQECPTDR